MKKTAAKAISLNNHKRVSSFISLPYTQRQQQQQQQCTTERSKAAYLVNSEGGATMKSNKVM
jgi:hypothetical protein